MATYAVVATIWILISDVVARVWTLNPNLLTGVSVAKGVVFVAVTSGLLFVLVRDYFARIQRVVDQLEDSEHQLRHAFESTVKVLGRVTEMRDPYTAGHQQRVSALAVAIARRMGMQETQVADIEIAGTIHDVGKMAVPFEILNKSGRLTPSELGMIHEHAQASYDILSHAHIPGDVVELVYQHHERCDGSGYPRGLKAQEILMGAKVLMVADVAEAISSERPYRPALGVEAARAEIEQGVGTLYDETVCHAFIEELEECGLTFERMSGDIEVGIPR